MQRFRILSAQIRFSALSTLAFAAGIAASTAQTIDQVVVTATRTEQSIEDVIGSATVITREQIEQRQNLSLQDLLRHEAGLDITSQGGFGKLTAMYIRGTEPEHVLVLIDGVRIGSVTAGSNPFEYLPLEQVERIEIVRGPRSSLYGSDAIGGVIQIFTRGGGDRASLTVGGGSLQTWRTTADLAMQFNDTWFAASGTYFESDGFNACRGSNTGGCFTVEPDDDGFRNVSGSARVGHRWGEVASVDVGALYSKGHNKYDGSFQNETAFREFAPSLRAHVKPVESWNVTLNAGASRDDQENFKDSRFTSYFNSERRSASLQSDLTLADIHIVTAGLDYLEDKVSSNTTYNVQSRDNRGVFAQYQVGLDRHKFSASARQDDNEQFGTHSTGNLGWKWQTTERISVLAAWGSAFRAPSFNDLYFPGFSNPNLMPEESRSYELGIAGNAGAWRGSLNAYKTDIDELIELDSTFTPANVAKAQIRGVEAIGSVALAAWDISLNYSYTDPRNRVPGANYDKILMRRARQSGSLEVAHNWDKARLAVIGRAQGTRFNNSANTSQLPGYATFDVVGEYSITNELKLEAKLANLLDKEYETVRFYNEAPRTFFVSLQYKPAFAN